VQRLENTSIVWDPVTGPGETYVKRRPVPFGEYVPFRSWLAGWISRFDRVARDFRAGAEPGVLDLAGVPVGVVICFEVADDGVVRDAIVGGGELLVVQTNNATYGRTPQPAQQLAITRLRSVEHGRATLVAATSGISAVIAPDGTLEQRSAEFVATSLVGEVSRRDALTIADRLGPWPERVAVLVAVVALIAAVRQRGSADRSPREENQVVA
jgi:apolipoprotein N-acyltransferase